MRIYDIINKLNESAERLHVGDDVIITGPVQYKGETGVIDSFGKDNRFVVVNLYNHGRHSFNSSDVSYNDYADSDAEEAEMYDRDPEFRDWAAKQEVNEDSKINWPKEVPSDREVERAHNQDEEENDPHPYVDPKEVDESQGDPYKILLNKLRDIERKPSAPSADDDAKRAEQAKADYAKYVAKMKKKDPNFVPLYKMDETNKWTTTK